MLNKVVLMGRLTADPELKHTPSNVAVCTFSLAVNRRFNRNETDFIDVVTWRQQAEFVSKYFAKGQQMALVAHFRQEHGKTRTATSARALKLL